MTHNRLNDALQERILLLDGGFGTMVQRYGLSEADYRGERFRLVEAVALHHRTETAVEQQDARGEKVAYVVRHFRMISISKSLLQFLPVTKMRLVAGS